MRLSTTETLAAATGSTGGLGKIGTIAATESIIVRCDCGDATEGVDWIVKGNKKHTVQLLRAGSAVNAATLTLNGVLNTETIIINGLTFTAHTDTTTLATRRFSIAGDNDADAVELATCINDATYGVPGVIAIASAGGIVTLTLAATAAASVIQALSGTAGAHCVAAETTAASLYKDGTASAVTTADTTVAGAFYQQTTHGWPYAYAKITNNEEADALTVIVKATRYR